MATEPERPESRLLCSAISLIARHGLEGLSLRELAGGASTSTSQFLRHFGSKEKLVAAVFNHGWMSIERHVSLRLFRPITSIEGMAEAVLNGVIDALEEDRDAVSASLIIAHSAIGQNLKPHLQGTAAHSRFFALVGQLRAQFSERLSTTEANEGLELLYGAALHRLVLATPLCQETAPPFDRAVFLELMDKMVRSIVDSGAPKTVGPGAT